MKPPQFAYAQPRTLAEALEVLAGDHDALPLAGGQSLMPMLNMRLARPTTVVDISRIEDLHNVEAKPGGVTVGALTTHHELARHPELGTVAALPRAVAEIGFPAIRNRGTIGGSLAHADPAAELPALLLALDATVELTSTTGSRTVAMDDFLVGYYSTSRRPDELITSVRVPVPANLRTGFCEFSRRPGDFAIALCAVATWKSDSGTRVGRVVLGGLDVRPVRVPHLEEVLAADPTMGPEAVSPELLGSVASPSSDIHGSADHRLQVGAEMARRALTEVAA